MKHDSKVNFLTSSETQQKSQDKQELDIQKSSKADENSIPDNLAGIAANLTFSPHRHRDISANVIPAIDSFISVPSSELQNNSESTKTSNKLLEYSDVPIGSFAAISNSLKSENEPNIQVESYDCSGPVSLNGVMQSNVPTPFDLTSNTIDDDRMKHDQLNHYTHLNMPRGQWSQESKFTAQDLQDSHYMVCNNKTESEFVEDAAKTITTVNKYNKKSAFSKLKFNTKDQQQELNKKGLF